MLLFVIDSHICGAVVVLLFLMVMVFMISFDVVTTSLVVGMLFQYVNFLDVFGLARLCRSHACVV